MLTPNPTESPHLEALNPAQRAAVAYGARDPDGRFSAGPLLVLAGAGTGKTRTLAHRVAHLILHGVPPERILLMTFSRRAAREMTRRAEAIVRRCEAAAGSRSGRASGLLRWSGTFHSMAHRVLRRHAREIGLHPSFSIIDRSDAADVMDLARQELGLASKKRRFPKKHTCLDIYSRVVNSQGTVVSCLEQSFPWCHEWSDELCSLFARYTEVKQESHILDYDDLLLYWSHLMSEPDLAAEVRADFDHVLVDEYQDTNLLQAAVLKALKPDGQGVTVVGDDAQSIYSFRAAEVRNILEFPCQYSPEAEVVKLEQNYRSLQPILDAANVLIAESPQACRKQLFSGRPSSARPMFVTVESELDQSRYVVEQVLAQREAGQLLREQAVLFRNAHHSASLELELTRRDIPFVKYGGLKFTESAHIKDVLAVLRWADNPRNRVAAFRILQLLPGIGPGYARRCLQLLQEHGYRVTALESFTPPLAAQQDWPALHRLLVELCTDQRPWQGQVSQVLHWYRPHLERRYDSVTAREGDLDQLAQISAQFASRETFLSELCLDPPQASGDFAGPPLLDEDYLILSTVHSAKGQEWKSVYLLHVSDGSFPSEFAAGKPALLEEERRLLYVALTRARSDLHLISPQRYYVPQQPKFGDRHVYGARSRFLSERLLGCFQKVSYPERQAEASRPSPKRQRVDLAARIRAMW